MAFCSVISISARGLITRRSCAVTGARGQRRAPRSAVSANLTPGARRPVLRRALPGSPLSPAPLGWGAEGPAGCSCPAIPAGLPVAFPPSTVASPPFARAGSAGTSRPLSKSGDTIRFYSVFFLPWGPQGRVAGRARDGSPGEVIMLHTQPSSVLSAQHGRRGVKKREMFYAICQSSNINNSIVRQQYI